MSLKNRAKQNLIAKAHTLHPVIIIGNQGVSAGVIQETDRALFDHELIKIRIPSGDKAEKTAMAEELAEKLQAECLKMIGNILIFYRASHKNDKK